VHGRLLALLMVAGLGVAGYFAFRAVVDHRQVRVEDESGLVAAWGEVQDRTGSSERLPEGDVMAAPLVGRVGPMRLHIYWVGTICQSRPLITVTGTQVALAVEVDPGPGADECEAGPRRYRITLTTSVPIDAGAVTAAYAS
jgi:hypothetical protein